MAELEKTIKALKNWKNDPLAMNAEIDPCLMDDALSVIESLQSENDILSENCDGLAKQRDDFATVIHEQKMEIERLREIATRDCDICANKMLKDERRWIPVSERLPEEYDTVEVWVKYENISVTAYWWNGRDYVKGCWVVCGTDGEKEYADYMVSHWRKPQPPKEGEQG